VIIIFGWLGETVGTGLDILATGITNTGTAVNLAIASFSEGAAKIGVGLGGAAVSTWDATLGLGFDTITDPDLWGGAAAFGNAGIAGVTSVAQFAAGTSLKGVEEVLGHETGYQELLDDSAESRADANTYASQGALGVTLAQQNFTQNLNEAATDASRDIERGTKLAGDGVIDLAQGVLYSAAANPKLQIAVAGYDELSGKEESTFGQYIDIVHSVDPYEAGPLDGERPVLAFDPTLPGYEPYPSIFGWDGLKDPAEVKAQQQPETVEPMTSSPAVTTNMTGAGPQPVRLKPKLTADAWEQNAAGLWSEFKAGLASTFPGAMSGILTGQGTINGVAGMLEVYQISQNIDEFLTGVLGIMPNDQHPKYLPIVAASGESMEKISRIAGNMTDVDQTVGNAPLRSVGRVISMIDSAIDS